MNEWSFLQCPNPKCQLRLPGEHGVKCPMCGKTLAEVAKRPLHVTSFAQPARDVVGVLDNIRSVHNVGSMFRTADGLGFSKLYLAGITPTPEHPKLAATALGAQTNVPWAQGNDGLELARQIKADGYTLIALESTSKASPLKEYEPTDKVAMIVGSEVTGIDPGLLDLADIHLTIPMAGVKRSYNVAVAFGMGAFHLMS